MPKHTLKGRYCSPASKGYGKQGDSCYSKDQLLKIALAYNQQYSSTINTNCNKEKLWDEIEKRMVQCNNEWCWMEKVHLDHEMNEFFRPSRPVGKYQWLSTSDIRDVLKQYEAIYPEFVFLGPVPLDFCNLASNEVCNINFRSSKRNGKTKIGIVFNTDPSTKPGKHWISMFIDINDPDPKKHEIGYFDSYGMAPMLPEIKDLVRKLQSQNPDIKIKLNCNDDICTSSIRHQRNNSECGIYSINYIVSRLEGTCWEDIVINSRWTDEQMANLRQKYFRPSIGEYHRY